MTERAVVRCPRWHELSEEERKEYWASLALRYCRGIGVRTRIRLLHYFGSAHAAVQQRKHWEEAGIDVARGRSLVTGEWRVAARREWDATIQTNPYVLLWTNPNYPNLLRKLPDAPSFLYAQGDITLLHTPCLAVVGSRRAGEKARRITATLVDALASAGITIVSGMAHGVDTVAHTRGLSHISKSIGVLGTGIRVMFPKENRLLFHKMAQEGLLLSEFAPDAPPNASNFPIRNRIISGLSLGVLVIEAAQRSGSLITARYALEQNREVYAVPGEACSNQSAGCHTLIRQGARPVFSADDILEDLLPQLRPFSTPSSQHSLDRNITLRDRGAQPVYGAFQKSSEGKADAPCASAQELTANDGDRILQLLREKGALQSDDIADYLQKESAATSSTLLGLELLGKIRRLPGSRFEVVS